MGNINFKPDLFEFLLGTNTDTLVLQDPDYMFTITTVISK